MLLLVILSLYWRTHANWLLLCVFLFAPDIAMFAYLRGTRLGAWCYNASHTYTAPALCLGASALIPLLLPVALIWAAHIAFDRAMGYGLKYDDSFTHTHLGVIGRNR